MINTGRFEKLILSMMPPTLFTTPDNLIACGVRISVDQVVSFLCDITLEGNASNSSNPSTSLASEELLASSDLPDVIVYSINLYTPQHMKKKENVEMVFSELNSNTIKVMYTLRKAVWIIALRIIIIIIPNRFYK